MGKRILICHPDVLDEVRNGTRLYCNELNVWANLDHVEVKTHPYMEKYRESSRYVLPDGSCVPPEDVTISDRFTEYGCEDIWYLLWAGIVRRERYPLFYIMEEPPSFLGVFGQYNMLITNPNVLLKPL